jgi:hypothetical protein
MAFRKPYSTAHLVAHSLEPSASSVIGCMAAAVVLMLGHILILSTYYGTLLPSAYDGQFASIYTNHVVQPLEVLLNAQLFNKALTIFLWSVLGLLVYFLFAYSSYILKGWKASDVAAEQRSSFRKDFELHIIWRFCLGLVAAVLFYGGRHLFHYLFGVDGRLFTESSVGGGDILRLALALCMWTSIMHIGVVLLRLYLFRTRVFGELLY